MMKKIIFIAIFAIAMSAKAQVSVSLTDSRDGKAYKTVTIGTQIWMSENLAYKANSGCCAYNNDTNNVAIYGYLYNWEAAKSACPAGWHLPSEVEFSTLITFLGGKKVAGGKLKSTTGWNGSSGGATNESGFIALPAGYLGINNLFYSIGDVSNWWSSTESSANASDMLVNFGGKAVFLENTKKKIAYSVRCVKD